MKTRLHKKQQNCSKLLTLFTMGVALLSGVVAMGLCTIRETYHQARAVSYDDEYYSITLSADELNNYHFNNLNLICYQIYYDVQEGGQIFNSFDYSDLTFDAFSYEGISNSSYYFYINDYGVGSYFLGFNYDSSDVTSSNYFLLFDSDESNIDFEYSLVLNCTSAYYPDIKQAIEQDILANQPNPSQPMLDFISIIVSGIGAFASGVATGVSDFASALFLDIEGGQVVGLSVFGGILAIFVGLALAVGITIKVYNWITSLGN